MSMSGETPGRQGTATPGDGPQCASSPTQTCSTRPSARSAKAFGNRIGKFVVIRLRAPESLHLVGELTGRIEGAQMRDASAEAQDGEEGNGVVGRVRQVKRHRIALADARLGETRRKLLDEPAKRRIIEPRLAIGKGRPSRPFGDRQVEKRGQGAGLHRCVPARRLRKGIDPGTRRLSAHHSGRMDFSEIGKRIEILRFLPRKLALSRRGQVSRGCKTAPAPSLFRQACFDEPVSTGALSFTRSRPPVA